MPKNALAPKPKNAMVRQEDPLQTLLRESSAYPQYGELTNYLTSRGMMPPILQEPLGVVGEFESPGAFSSEVPKSGVVRLSYSATPATPVHELTHAAQRQLESQYFELRQRQRNGSITPEEQQFMRGYEKLIYDRGEMFGNKPQSTQSLTAQRIAPSWYAAKKDYRATGPELAAFGMGSAVQPNVGYPAPLHIDPSYATEFSILLDMANRLQKSPPTTSKK